MARKWLSTLSLSGPDTSCQHATIFLIVLHTVGHSEGQQKDLKGDLIHLCFSTIHTNRNAPEFKVPLEDVEGKKVLQTFCKWVHTLFSFKANFELSYSRAASVLKRSLFFFFKRQSPSTLKAPEFHFQESLPSRTMAACPDNPPFLFGWLPVNSSCSPTDAFTPALSDTGPLAVPHARTLTFGHSETELSLSRPQPSGMLSLQTFILLPLLHV